MKVTPQRIGKSQPATRWIRSLMLTALLIGIASLGRSPATQAAPTLISQGKPATSSSNENAGTTPNLAVDNNAGTRWSSAWSDPQWLQLDLGSSFAISRVVLNWEAAYGKAYQIQVSPNGVNWTSLYSTATGDGGIDDLAVSGAGRFVRIYGTVRGTAYGYSLWEFQVYGEPAVTATPTSGPPTPPPTATQPPAGCGSANAALGRPATASSVENAGLGAGLAADGNAGTRWASAFSDPQWLQIDLGSTQAICRVVLNWEAAYGKAYQIQVSDNATSWATIYGTAAGDGGIDTLGGLSGSGRFVRIYGTVRGTAYGYSLWEVQVNTASGPVTPTATAQPTAIPTATPIVPTVAPDSFWGDTSNIPAANNVLTLKFLNRTNGKYPDSQVYWSFNGQTHSIAERPTFDMPANSAGRMYFYLGSPNSQYTDFIEFTVGPDVFNGNTTRVDWFGIKLAMRLRAHDGYDQAVGEDYATFAEDRAVTFQKFINEVPAEFDHLAQIKAPYMIPAPGKMGDTRFLPSGQYANYFASYAQSVGVNASIFDIMACAGSLANNAQLCAALNRHVAHLPLADQRNPANFYKAGPANYYAKFWHDHSLQKLAYGFPYDDYAEQSSFVSHGDPQWLLVAIGW